MKYAKGLSRLSRTLSLVARAAVVCLLAGAAATVWAQHAPGPGPGPGHEPGMPFGPPSSQPSPTPNVSRPMSRSYVTPGNASVSPIAQFGPPGRWWDNQQFATSMGIDLGQKRRMDQVFSANRSTLLSRYLTLKHEEAQLDKLIQRGSDEKRIDDQINRVAEARAELEKANTHMILALRKELTTEQAKRIEQANTSAQVSR